MQEIYRPIYDKLIELVIMDEKDHPYPLHTHGSIEIMYVLSGVLRVTLDGETLEAGADDIVLIGPYSTHAFPGNSANNRICLIIPEIFFQDFNGVFLSKVSGVFRNKDINRFLLNIIQDYRELIKEEKDNFISAKGLCFMLFGVMDKVYKLFGKSDKVVNLTMLEIVVKYINENYRNPISLNELVKETGYNRFYISKEFNKNFKISLSDYINKIRLLAFVSEMQKNSSLNITTVALSCGFSSISTFYAVFKKEYGVSPKEYFSVK